MALILPAPSLLVLGKYDEMGNCTMVGTAVVAVAVAGATQETPRETADLEVETDDDDDEVVEDLLVLATSIALQN